MAKKRKRPDSGVIQMPLPTGGSSSTFDPSLSASPTTTVLPGPMPTLQFKPSAKASKMSKSQRLVARRARRQLQREQQSASDASIPGVTIERQTRVRGRKGKARRAPSGVQVDPTNPRATSDPTVPGAARTQRTTRKLARAQRRVRDITDALDREPQGKKRTKLLRELRTLLTRNASDLPQDLIDRANAQITATAETVLREDGIDPNAPPAVITGPNGEPIFVDPATVTDPITGAAMPEVAATGAKLDLLSQLLGASQSGKKNRQNIKVVIKRLEQVMGDKLTAGKRAVITKDGESNVVSGRGADVAYEGSTASFGKHSNLVGPEGFGTFGKSAYAGDGAVMVRGKNPKVVGPGSTGLFAGSQMFPNDGTLPNEQVDPNAANYDEAGNYIGPPGAESAASYDETEPVYDPYGEQGGYVDPGYGPDAGYDDTALPADDAGFDFGFDTMPTIPTDLQQRMSPPLTMADYRWYGNEIPEDELLSPAGDGLVPFADVTEFDDVLDFDPWSGGEGPQDPALLDDVNAQEALDFAEETLGDIDELVRTRLQPRLDQLVRDARATGDKSLARRAQALAYAAKNAEIGVARGLEGCAIAAEDGLSGPLSNPVALASAARAAAKVAGNAFNWLVAGLALGAGQKASAGETIGNAIMRGLAIAGPIVALSWFAKNFSRGRRR